MNIKSIAPLIGVFTSLLVIWGLHTILVVDDCVDHDGTYNYDTAKCQLSNGQIYQAENTSLYLLVYFAVGFFVSLIVARVIKKIFIKD